MTALPPYADNEIGRALLAAIIENPPELGPDHWKLGGYREPCEPDYRGKPAARLRRLESEWKDRQYTILDAQFAATGVWDDSRLRVETANQLIERVLREAARKAAA